MIYIHVIWIVYRKYCEINVLEIILEHLPRFQALGIRLLAFLEGQQSAEIYLSRDFQCEENFLDDGKKHLVYLLSLGYIHVSLGKEIENALKKELKIYL